MVRCGLYPSLDSDLPMLIDNWYGVTFHRFKKIVLNSASKRGIGGHFHLLLALSDGLNLNLAHVCALTYYPPASVYGVHIPMMSPVGRRLGPTSLVEQS